MRDNPNDQPAAGRQPDRAAILADLVAAGAGDATPLNLAHLAQHTDWGVRAAVAGNANTPGHVLTALAGDVAYSVMAAAAGNINTTREGFDRLTEPRRRLDDGTIRALLANPAVPADAFKKTARVRRRNRSPAPRRGGSPATPALRWPQP